MSDPQHAPQPSPQSPTPNNDDPSLAATRLDRIEQRLNRVERHLGFEADAELILVPISASRLPLDRAPQSTSIDLERLNRQRNQVRQQADARADNAATTDQPKSLSPVDPMSPQPIAD